MLLGGKGPMARLTSTGKPGAIQEQSFAAKLRHAAAKLELRRPTRKAAPSRVVGLQEELANLNSKLAGMDDAIQHMQAHHAEELAAAAAATRRVEARLADALQAAQRHGAARAAADARSAELAAMLSTLRAQEQETQAALVANDKLLRDMWQRLRHDQRTHQDAMRQQQEQAAAAHNGVVLELGAAQEQLQQWQVGYAQLQQAYLQLQASSEALREHAVRQLQAAHQQVNNVNAVVTALATDGCVLRGQVGQQQATAAQQLAANAHLQALLAAALQGLTGKDAELGRSAQQLGDLQAQLEAAVEEREAAAAAAEDFAAQRTRLQHQLDAAVEQRDLAAAAAQDMAPQRTRLPQEQQQQQQDQTAAAVTLVHNGTQTGDSSIDSCMVAAFNQGSGSPSLLLRSTSLPSAASGVTVMSSSKAPGPQLAHWGSSGSFSAVEQLRGSGSDTGELLPAAGIHSATVVVPAGRGTSCEDGDGDGDGGSRGGSMHGSGDDGGAAAALDEGLIDVAGDEMPSHDDVCVTVLLFPAGGGALGKVPLPAVEAGGDVVDSCPEAHDV